MKKIIRMMMLTVSLVFVFVSVAPSQHFVYANDEIIDNGIRIRSDRIEVDRRNQRQTDASADLFKRYSTNQLNAYKEGKNNQSPTTNLFQNGVETNMKPYVTTTLFQKQEDRITYTVSSTQEVASKQELPLVLYVSVAFLLCLVGICIHYVLTRGEK